MDSNYARRVIEESILAMIHRAANEKELDSIENAVCSVVDEMNLMYLRIRTRMNEKKTALKQN